MASSNSINGVHPGKGGHEDVVFDPTRYPAAFTRDWSRLTTHLGADAAKTLREQGFVVIEGLWGSGWSHAYRTELQWLQKHGLMEPNRTQFATSQGARLFTKPHIFERDLHYDTIRSRVPEFNALFAHSQKLVTALNSAMPELRLSGDCQANKTTIKLQYNEGGGGCFPMHYDNPGPPNCRKLTVLTYLNPEWQEGDGGELQLYSPFLGQATTIAPRHDRTVLFLSDMILHRVLPAVKPRYCFTIWLDGDVTNQPQDREIRLTPEVKDNPASLALLLNSTPLQRSLSRAVYAEAYEESLLQCMKGAPGCEEMVESHRRHVMATNQSTPVQRIVNTLRSLIGTDIGNLMQIQMGEKHYLHPQIRMVPAITKRSAGRVRRAGQDDSSSSSEDDNDDDLGAADMGDLF